MAFPRKKDARFRRTNGAIMALRRGNASLQHSVITPERFTAVITSVERFPPHTDEDRLANFRTMVAYSGLYRIEGNELTTEADVAWTEAWKGTRLVRFCRIEGDKLFIETAPFLSALPPAERIIRILEWERSK